MVRKELKEGEPRRNGAKHWTARLGLSGSEALDDDVLDVLGTPRRNGAKHWTARRGNEAWVPGSWEPKIPSRRHQMASWPRGEEVERTRRCWECLDDADEDLLGDSVDAAGSRVAAAPYWRVEVLVVGGCCCGSADPSELEYECAVLDVGQVVEERAVLRHRDPEVRRPNRRLLEPELV